MRIMRFFKPKSQPPQGYRNPDKWTAQHVNHVCIAVVNMVIRPTIVAHRPRRHDHQNSRGPAPSLVTRSSKGRSQPIPNQSHGHNSPRKYTLGTHSPSTPGSVYVTSGLPMKPMRQVGPRADKCQVEGESRSKKLCVGRRERAESEMV